MKSPLVNEEENEEDKLDEKIQKNKNKENSDEYKGPSLDDIIQLIDKEYNQIFVEGQNKEKNKIIHLKVKKILIPNIVLIPMKLKIKMRKI